MDTLLTRTTLVTGGPTGQVIRDGALAVQGDRIVAVGTSSELEKRYPDLPHVALPRRAVIPGLINCHDHLCNKWLRATPASDYQAARLKRRHSNPGTHALEIRSLLIPTLRRTDPHPEVLEGYSAAASV
mgnify:CR=1 FL=1